MTAAKQTALMTVAEYLAAELDSDVKHEYLGGYVYAMAGGRNSHHRIATSFVVAVGQRLSNKPCQPFNSDVKIRIQGPNFTRFYYPDGMIVGDPNAADEAFQDRPVVILEVLSDSTRRVDETEKREAYLTIPSLAAYLLVEQDSPQVVVYRRSDGEFVREELSGLDAVIPLPEVEASLPLAELYARIEFLPAGEC